MKNLIFMGFMIFALSFVTNAQGVDLKSIGADKQAEAIKKFTDLLSDFYLSVLFESAPKSSAPGGVQGPSFRTLEDKAKKIRPEINKHYDNLQFLIARLKPDHFDEQFDKDVAKLLGGNKVKSRLVKSGGMRKLLESLVSMAAVNELKTSVNEASTLKEIDKNETVCKYLAAGIVVEALLFKKATTGNDKFYGQYGCTK